MFTTPLYPSEGGALEVPPCGLKLEEPLANYALVERDSSTQQVATVDSTL
jgi:hypothetical protein